MVFRWAVLALFIVWQGCSPPQAAPEPRSETDPQPAATSTPLTLASADGTVLRLSEAYRVYRSALQSAPVVPDPASFTRLNDATDGATAGSVRVALPRVPARLYNECRVRLVATDANACRLTWRNTGAPRPAKGMSITVLADNQPHEYIFDLNDAPAGSWSGTVDELLFQAEPDGDLRVEAVELRYTPHRGPDRVTLDYLTMETVAEPAVDWTFTVPPRAQFEAHAAALAAPDTFSGGCRVRFTATIAADDGHRLAIGECVVDNAVHWTPLRADLADYAGRTVTVSLRASVDPDTPYVQPVWGNPLVTARADTRATPVVLISLDTTRADHLGCYGYSRDTSPNLDAFAKESVLFENAFTPETWTLTAHVSMLTGLYPKRHRVAATTNLAEEVSTLPEVLRGAGYLSAGFTGYRIWLQPTRGLSHGFDLYSTPALVRDLFDTSKHVLPWLERHPQMPFFLFFHSYDHHSKYRQAGCEGCDLPYYPARSEYRKFSNELVEPPTLRAPGRERSTDLLFAALEGRDTLSPDELAYTIALYDDSIVAVDAGIGRLFEHLKTLDVYNHALIIVTADHGENFGEHGQFLHEHLYEGAARVPLLIRFPNGAHAGTRIPQMVELIDLMPTVLDVLNLDAPPMDGQSLLPIVRGEGAPRPAAFLRRQRHIAVRTPEWKLIRNIRNGAEELYDLVNDPKETVNRIGENPPQLAQLRAQLDHFFTEPGHGWHVAFTAPRGEWRGRLTATTNDRIATAHMMFGGHMSREDLYTLDDHTLRVTLGPLKREEIIVRTADPAAKVLLRIEADSPFAVQMGAATPVVATTFETTLDPATPLDAPALVESGLPTLRVWYQTETIEGGAASPLTEEEKEQLRGIGYGGDVQ